MMENIAPLYRTKRGAAYLGDSLGLLDKLDSNSINLVVTSPPFSLLRQKEYGNVAQDRYVDWIAEFAKKIKEVLTTDGSFVLDLGGAYVNGKPVRSLYNYKVLIKLCDELGFFLAEEFFWHNPAKLPSPIEWVNKRKVRAKDSVNTVWWFSKSEHPKADVTKVLVSYSERMKKLLKNNTNYYTPKMRPSGHDISANFNIDRGGAIPSNLLQIPHTESNTKYLRNCKLVNLKPHPARFPKALPEFFIKLLTNEGDTVLDIFAGSNTTGEAAEDNARNWLAFELDRNYLAASSFRFLRTAETETLKRAYSTLTNETLEGIYLNDLDYSVSQIPLFGAKKNWA